MAINTYLALITLSVNELNALNKRQSSSWGLVDKLFSDSLVTPGTVACQAPLSMWSPRQEYRSGLHFIFQGIFLTQGWKPCLLHWQAESLPLSYLAFLYTNNKIEEAKVRKKKSLLKLHKQYLGINLTKKVKDLHVESYKTLIKEIADDSKKWKNSPCSWIGRINIA